MQFIALFALDVASSEVPFVVVVVSAPRSFPCASAFCCLVVVGFENICKDFQKCGKGSVGNTDGTCLSGRWFDAGRRQWSAAEMAVFEHAARLRER